MPFGRWPRIEAIAELVGHAAGAHLEVVVHQVVAELAAVVAQPVREAIRFRVEQDEGRGDRRCAQEDDAREVLARLVRLGVDDPHAGGALRGGVVDQLGDDRERAQRQLAGGVGGRQRRGVAAEVGAVGAAADAAVAVLAAAAAVVRLRQVGDAADDHRPAAEVLRDPVLHLPLEAVHLHRRQELSVGELRQALTAAADAGKALDAVVPRRQVLVADRPVHRDAVAGVGLEIELAEPVGLPAPQQRAPADVVAAHPVEALDLGVGILDVVDEPVRRRGMRGVAGAVLLLLLLQVCLRDAVAAGELPALRHRGGIVGMLDVAPALEHERPQPFLRQLLRGPAAADAGPDDNRVVGAFGPSRALDEHAGQGYRGARPPATGADPRLKAQPSSAAEGVPSHRGCRDESTRSLAADLHHEAV